MRRLLVKAAMSGDWFPNSSLGIVKVASVKADVDGLYEMLGVEPDASDAEVRTTLPFSGEPVFINGIPITSSHPMRHAHDAITGLPLIASQHSSRLIAAGSSRVGWTT